MDIEDAHRLGILTSEQVFTYLLPFLEHVPLQKQRFVKQSKSLSSDEKIAYLRSLIINILVRECATIFINHYPSIMSGNFNSSLATMLPNEVKPQLDNCKKLGINSIYSDSGVRKLEISGHKVLTTLMQTYVEAILSPEKYYSTLLTSTIPPLYKTNGTPYEKVRLITDYISSMTDTQAVKLYREFMGIDIPQRSH